MNMQTIHMFGGWSPCGSYNTTIPLVVFGILLLVGVGLVARGYVLNQRLPSKQHSKINGGLMVFGAVIAGLALYLLLAGQTSVLGNLNYCKRVENSNTPIQTVARSPAPDIHETPQAVDKQRIATQGSTLYNDARGRFSISVPKDWTQQGGGSVERLFNAFSKSSRKQYGHVYVELRDSLPSPQATYKHVYILQNGEVLYAQAPVTNTRYLVWCTYDHTAAEKLRDVCETALQSFIPLK
jgi:hypothetical protein